MFRGAGGDCRPARSAPRRWRLASIPAVVPQIYHSPYSDEPAPAHPGTDELDATPTLRIRHRPAPVSALRRSIARAGGHHRPAGDRHHARAHRHSRRPPRHPDHAPALHPGPSRRRRCPKRARASCQWISPPPPPCQPLPPSRVSHRRYRVYRTHRRPPSIPHDSHPDVRDTAPRRRYGYLEFLSAEVDTLTPGADTSFTTTPASSVSPASPASSRQDYRDVLHVVRLLHRD